MFNYIVRKVLILIPTLLFISFLIYLGVELMPGDAVDYLVSPDALAQISPEQLEILRDELGLNDPFMVRYFNWLTNVFKGEFGYSIQSGIEVSQLLATTIPATLELSLIALCFSTLFGSILGIISALKRGTILDNVLSVAGMIGIAIPIFLFGLIMIVVFSYKLGWFPVGFRYTLGQEQFFQRLDHLVLPAAVLGLNLTAAVMRYSRSSMLDALNKDYIKTARSKGLKEWRINFVHGFRVAMTPVVVLVGFRLPMLIAGAVICEQVFQWPGVGQQFVSAVTNQNTPVIMMISFFTVSFVLVMSIIVDILTALLDPRIKLS